MRRASNLQKAIALFLSVCLLPSDVLAASDSRIFEGVKGANYAVRTLSTIAGKAKSELRQIANHFETNPNQDLILPTSKSELRANWQLVYLDVRDVIQALDRVELRLRDIFGVMEKETLYFTDKDRSNALMMIRIISEMSATYQNFLEKMKPLKAGNPYVWLPEHFNVEQLYSHIGLINLLFFDADDLRTAEFRLTDQVHNLHDDLRAALTAIRRLKGIFEYRGPVDDTRSEMRNMDVMVQEFIDHGRMLFDHYENVDREQAFADYEDSPFLQMSYTLFDDLNQALVALVDAPFSDDDVAEIVGQVHAEWQSQGWDKKIGSFLDHFVLADKRFLETDVYRFHQNRLFSILSKIDDIESRLKAWRTYIVASVYHLRHLGVHSDADPPLAPIAADSQLIIENVKDYLLPDFLAWREEKGSITRREDVELNQQMLWTLGLSMDLRVYDAQNTVYRLERDTDFANTLLRYPGGAEESIPHLMRPLFEQHRDVLPSLIQEIYTLYQDKPEWNWNLGAMRLFAEQKHRVLALGEGFERLPYVQHEELSRIARAREDLDFGMYEPYAHAIELYQLDPIALLNQAYEMHDEPEAIARFLAAQVNEDNLVPLEVFEQGLADQIGALRPGENYFPDQVGVAADLTEVFNQEGWDVLMQWIKYALLLVARKYRNEWDAHERPLQGARDFQPGAIIRLTGFPMNAIVLNRDEDAAVLLDLDNFSMITVPMDNLQFQGYRVLHLPQSEMREEVAEAEVETEEGEKKKNRKEKVITALRWIGAVTAAGGAYLTFKVVSAEQVGVSYVPILIEGWTLNIFAILIAKRFKETRWRARALIVLTIIASLYLFHVVLPPYLWAAWPDHYQFYSDFSVFNFFVRIILLRMPTVFTAIMLTKIITHKKKNPGEPIPWRDALKKSFDWSIDFGLFTGYFFYMISLPSISLIIPEQNYIPFLGVWWSSAYIRTLFDITWATFFLNMHTMVLFAAYYGESQDTSIRKNLRKSFLLFPLGFIYWIIIGPPLWGYFGEVNSKFLLTSAVFIAIFTVGIEYFIREEEPKSEKIEVKSEVRESSQEAHARIGRAMDAFAELYQVRRKRLGWFPVASKSFTGQRDDYFLNILSSAVPNENRRLIHSWRPNEVSGSAGCKVCQGVHGVDFMGQTPSSGFVLHQYTRHDDTVMSWDGANRRAHEIAQSVLHMRDSKTRMVIGIFRSDMKEEIRTIYEDRLGPKVDGDLKLLLIERDREKHHIAHSISTVDGLGVRVFHIYNDASAYIDVFRTWDEVRALLTEEPITYIDLQTLIDQDQALAGADVSESNSEMRLSNESVRELLDAKASGYDLPEPSDDLEGKAQRISKYFIVPPDKPYYMPGQSTVPRIPHLVGQKRRHDITALRDQVGRGALANLATPHWRPVGSIVAHADTLNLIMPPMNFSPQFAQVSGWVEHFKQIGAKQIKLLAQQDGGNASYWKQFSKDIRSDLIFMQQVIPEVEDVSQILTEVNQHWQSQGWDQTLGGGILEHFILSHKRPMMTEDYEASQYFVFEVIRSIDDLEARLWAWQVYMAVSVFHLRAFGYHVEKVPTQRSRAVDNEILMDLVDKYFLEDYFAWHEANEQQIAARNDGVVSTHNAMVWAYGQVLDYRVHAANSRIQDALSDDEMFDSGYQGYSRDQKPLTDAKTSVKHYLGAMLLGKDRAKMRQLVADVIALYHQTRKGGEFHWDGTYNLPIHLYPHLLSREGGLRGFQQYSRRELRKLRKRHKYELGYHRKQYLRNELNSTDAIDAFAEHPYRALAREFESSNDLEEMVERLATFAENSQRTTQAREKQHLEALHWELSLEELTRAASEGKLDVRGRLLDDVVSARNKDIAEQIAERLRFVIGQHVFFEPIFTMNDSLVTDFRELRPGDIFTFQENRLNRPVQNIDAQIPYDTRRYFLAHLEELDGILTVDAVGDLTFTPANVFAIEEFPIYRFTFAETESQSEMRLLTNEGMMSLLQRKASRYEVAHDRYGNRDWLDQKIQQFGMTASAATDTTYYFPRFGHVLTLPNIVLKKRQQDMARFTRGMVEQGRRGDPGEFLEPFRDMGTVAAVLTANSARPPWGVDVKQVSEWVELLNLMGEKNYQIFEAAHEDPIDQWESFSQAIRLILVSLQEEVEDVADVSEILSQVHSNWQARGWNQRLGGILEHFILSQKRPMLLENYEASQYYVFEIIRSIDDLEARLWAWHAYIAFSVFHLRAFGYHVEKNPAQKSRAADNEILAELIDGYFLDDYFAWYGKHEQALEDRDVEVVATNRDMIWAYGQILDYRIHAANSRAKSFDHEDTLFDHPYQAYAKGEKRLSSPKESISHYLGEMLLRKDPVRMRKLVADVIGLYRSSKQTDSHRWNGSYNFPLHFYPFILAAENGFRDLGRISRQQFRSFLKNNRDRLSKFEPAEATLSLRATDAIDGFAVDPYEALADAFEQEEDFEKMIAVLAGLAEDKHRVTAAGVQEKINALLHEFDLENLAAAIGNRRFDEQGRLQEEHVSENNRAIAASLAEQLRLSTRQVFFFEPLFGVADVESFPPINLRSGEMIAFAPNSLFESPSELDKQVPYDSSRIVVTHASQPPGVLTVDFAGNIVFTSNNLFRQANTRFIAAELMDFMRSEMRSDDHELEKFDLEEPDKLVHLLDGDNDRLIPVAINYAQLFFHIAEEIKVVEDLTGDLFFELRVDSEATKMHLHLEPDQDDSDNNLVLGRNYSSLGVDVHNDDFPVIVEMVKPMEESSDARFISGLRIALDKTENQYLVFKIAHRVEQGVYRAINVNRILGLRADQRGRIVDTTNLMSEYLPPAKELVLLVYLQPGPIERTPMEPGTIIHSEMRTVAEPYVYTWEGERFVSLPNADEFSGKEPYQEGVTRRHDAVERGRYRQKSAQGLHSMRSDILIRFIDAAYRRHHYHKKYLSPKPYRIELTSASSKGFGDQGIYELAEDELAVFLEEKWPAGVLMRVEHSYPIFRNRSEESNNLFVHQVGIRIRYESDVTEDQKRTDKAYTTMTPTWHEKRGGRKEDDVTFFRKVINWAKRVYWIYDESVHSDRVTNQDYDRRGFGPQVVVAGDAAGRDTEFLVREEKINKRVMGIDSNRAMIREARARAPDLEFKEMSVLDLQFEEASLALLIYHMVFINVDDEGVKRALEEAGFALDNNGVIGIRTKARRPGGPKVARVPIDESGEHYRYERYYTLEELIAYLNQAGFEVLETHSQAETGDEAGHATARGIDLIEIIAKRKPRKSYYGNYGRHLRFSPIRLVAAGVAQSEMRNGRGSIDYAAASQMAPEELIEEMRSRLAGIRRAKDATAQLRKDTTSMEHVRTWLYRRLLDETEHEREHMLMVLFEELRWARDHKTAQAAKTEDTRSGKQMLEVAAIKTLFDVVARPDRYGAPEVVVIQTMRGLIRDIHATKDGVDALRGMQEVLEWMQHQIFRMRRIADPWQSISQGLEPLLDEIKRYTHTEVHQRAAAHIAYLNRHRQESMASRPNDAAWQYILLNFFPPELREIAGYEQVVSEGDGRWRVRLTDSAHEVVLATLVITDTRHPDYGNNQLYVENLEVAPRGEGNKRRIGGVSAWIHGQLVDFATRAGYEDIVVSTRLIPNDRQGGHSIVSLYKDYGDFVLASTGNEKRDFLLRMKLRIRENSNLQNIRDIDEFVVREFRRSDLIDSTVHFSFPIMQNWPVERFASELQTVHERLRPRYAAEYAFRVLDHLVTRLGRGRTLLNEFSTSFHERLRPDMANSRFNRLADQLFLNAQGGLSEFEETQRLLREILQRPSDLRPTFWGERLSRSFRVEYLKWEFHQRALWDAELARIFLEEDFGKAGKFGRSTIARDLNSALGRSEMREALIDHLREQAYPDVTENYRSLPWINQKLAQLEDRQYEMVTNRVEQHRFHSMPRILKRKYLEDLSGFHGRLRDEWSTAAFNDGGDLANQNVRLNKLKEDLEVQLEVERRQDVAFWVGHLMQVGSEGITRLEESPESVTLKDQQDFLAEIYIAIERLISSIDSSTRLAEILTEVNRQWKGKGWDEKYGSILEYFILSFRQPISTQNIEDANRFLFEIIRLVDDRESRLWAWHAYIVFSVYHLRHFGYHVEKVSGQKSRAVDNELLVELVKDYFIPDYFAWLEKNQGSLREKRDTKFAVMKQTMIWAFGQTLDFRIYDADSRVNPYDPDNPIYDHPHNAHTKSGIRLSNARASITYYLNEILSSAPEKQMRGLVRDVVKLYRKTKDRDSFEWHGAKGRLFAALPILFAKNEGLRNLKGWSRTQIFYSYKRERKTLFSGPDSIDLFTVNPYEELDKAFRTSSKLTEVVDKLAEFSADAYRSTRQREARAIRQLQSQVDLIAINDQIAQRGFDRSGLLHDSLRSPAQIEVTEKLGRHIRLVSEQRKFFKNPLNMDFSQIKDEDQIQPGDLIVHSQGEMVDSFVKPGFEHSVSHYDGSLILYRVDKGDPHFVTVDTNGDIRIALVSVVEKKLANYYKVELPEPMQLSEMRVFSPSLRGDQPNREFDFIRDKVNSPVSPREAADSFRRYLGYSEGSGVLYVDAALLAQSEIRDELYLMAEATPVKISIYQAEQLNAEVYAIFSELRSVQLIRGGFQRALKKMGDKFSGNHVHVVSSAGTQPTEGVYRFLVEKPLELWAALILALKDEVAPGLRKEDGIFRAMQGFLKTVIQPFRASYIVRTSA